MKKYAIIMLLLVAMFTAGAQTGTFQLNPTQTMLTVGTDYTLTNAVESYFVFKAEKNNPVAVDYKVQLTKGTGSHTETTVVLSGRKFSTDAWVTIATGLSGNITTTGSVALNFPGTLQYREFKVGLTGTGTGTTTISSQEFKVWYK